ncbi:MAG: hypothetical protein WC756_15540 [Taibaiella sp.]|jgi:hypothetical protein
MDRSYINLVSEEISKYIPGSEINKYFSEYALHFNKVIQYEQKPLGKAPSIMFFLDHFSTAQKFYVINDLLDKPKLAYKNGIKELHARLLKDYKEYDANEVEGEELNEKLINQTRHWLDSYPAVLKVYNSAIEKYELHSFQRNILDDLRLALEQLLKLMFNNNAPLEKQVNNVGMYLEEKGGSKEYRVMFTTLISHYTNYQNNNVKHDNNVNDNEVEFMIEMTSVFMKNLISLK